jgi:hypothetical protein
MAVATRPKTKVKKSTTTTRTAKAPRTGAGEMRMTCGGEIVVEGVYTPIEFATRIAKWLVGHYKNGGTFNATIRGTLPAPPTRSR